MNAGSSRTSGAQAWGTSEPSHHLLPGSDDRPAWWPPGSLYCSWGVWTQLGSVSVASWIRAPGPLPSCGRLALPLAPVPSAWRSLSPSPCSAPGPRPAWPQPCRPVTSGPALRTGALGSHPAPVLDPVPEVSSLIVPFQPWFNQAPKGASLAPSLTWFP